MTTFHYLLPLELISSTPNDHNQSKISINPNLVDKYLDNSFIKKPKAPELEPFCVWHPNLECHSVTTL